MLTKKNDFIEVEFIAKVKETNQIFDLTDENLAKEYKIYNPDYKYKPIKLCIGQEEVVKGLDEDLENKELNKEYEVEIPPEKAFGKRDPNKIILIATSKFLQQKINPVPGLQVVLDNELATIKTVTGGRTLVDFNYPLAGKTVIYKFKILRKIEDKKEKLDSLLYNLFKNEIKVEIKENKAVIDLKAPKEIQDKLKEKIKELIKDIKEVSFETDNKK